MSASTTAGSGTNQQITGYKLGPPHEGKLESGAKTGSFDSDVAVSCGRFGVCWEAYANFDTANLPFSHLEAKRGRCELIPGIHIATVGSCAMGTNGEARSAERSDCADILCFKFSIRCRWRMVSGAEVLSRLQNRRCSVAVVNGVGFRLNGCCNEDGPNVTRRPLRRYCRTDIPAHGAKNWRDAPELQRSLCRRSESRYSNEWLDIGGQLLRADDSSARERKREWRN